MTQPDRSTVSSAVFTSAWIEFCRTSEGRQEYWRRFGDYLFTNPQREIPRELLSLPPYILRLRSCRQRTLRRWRGCARRPLSAAQLSRLRQSSDLNPASFRPCRSGAKFPALRRWAGSGHTISRSFAALSNNRRRRRNVEAAQSPGRMLLAGQYPLGPR